MLKVTAICAVLAVLCGCASIGFGRGAESSAPTASLSPSEKIDENHWVTPPRANELVVVGVSGRMSGGAEAEIQNAREDAARKIAMYYGIYAEHESGQSIGSGYFDVSVNTRTNVEYDQQIEQYIDKLVFNPERDVFSMGNAIYIRFTYPEVFPGNIHYTLEKNQNGNPLWTTSPPHEISGIRAGVGFVRRQERLRDAIIKSYEAAAAALVSSASSSVSAIEIDTSTVNASGVRHYSAGRLSHFLVLETWIDPNTGSVWTLAVAHATN